MGSGHSPAQWGCGPALEDFTADPLETLWVDGWTDEGWMEE